MKKLLLLLLTLVSFVGVQAQSATFEPQSGDTSIANFNYSSGRTDMKVFNLLRLANGVSPRILEWRYLSHNVPAGWSIEGVCDNINCRGMSSITGGNWNQTDTIRNIAAQFYFSLLDVPTNGVGILRVEVRDPQVPGSNRTLTFIANRSPLGISTTVRSEESIKIFPNPARESVNVLFESSENIKTIGIYNLLGQPISMFHVIGNSAKLPLNDAPDGVYFLRMYDGQGKIVATRRFTRQ